MEEILSKLSEAYGERDRFESYLFMKGNWYSWQRYKTKQKKKLHTEDVTSVVHDFQEPICLSVP